MSNVGKCNASVTYDGCFVDTTDGAIDIYTGIFTVAKAGVYSISFTAKYVSSSKGRFGAWSDVFVNNTVSLKWASNLM